MSWLFLFSLLSVFALLYLNPSHPFLWGKMWIVPFFAFHLKKKIKKFSAVDIFPHLKQGIKLTTWVTPDTRRLVETDQTQHLPKNSNCQLSHSFTSSLKMKGLKISNSICVSAPLFLLQMASLLACTEESAALPMNSGEDQRFNCFTSSSVFCCYELRPRSPWRALAQLVFQGRSVSLFADPCFLAYTFKW